MRYIVIVLTVVVAAFSAWCPRSLAQSDARLPDGRQLILSARARMGDVDRVRSLGHTARLPQALAEAMGTGPSVRLSWVQPNTLVMRSPLLGTGVFDGRFTWSTEDEGATWIVEKEYNPHEILTMLGFLSPQAVLHGALSTYHSFETIGRVVFGGRQAYEIAARHTRFKDLNLRYYVDAATGEFAGVNLSGADAEVAFTHWGALDGMRIVTRAELRLPDGVHEATFSEYVFNGVDPSMARMPDAVRDELVPLLQYDPVACNPRDLVLRAVSRLGPIRAVDDLTFTPAGIPIEWWQYDAAKYPATNGSIVDRRRIASPMLFLRDLSSYDGFATQGVSNSDNPNYFYIEAWRHRGQLDYVTLRVTPDAKILGFSIGSAHEFNVLEWAEADGLCVISRAEVSNKGATPEFEALYKDCRVKWREGATPPPTAEDERWSAAELNPAVKRPGAAAQNDDDVKEFFDDFARAVDDLSESQDPLLPGGRELIDRAIEKMGITDYHQIMSVRHTVTVPQELANEVGSRELTVSALRPGTIRFDTPGNDGQQKAAVRRGTSAWSTEDSGKTWRVDNLEIGAVEMLSAAMSPLTYLIAMRDRFADCGTDEIVEIEGVRCYAIELWYVDDFWWDTAYVRVDNGEFHGVTLGNHVIIEEWTTHAGIRVPKRARARFSEDGEWFEFEYGAYEFNTVPDSIGIMPDNIRAELAAQLGYDPVHEEGRQLVVDALATLGPVQRIKGMTVTAYLDDAWRVWSEDGYPEDSFTIADYERILSPFAFLSLVPNFDYFETVPLENDGEEETKAFDVWVWDGERQIGAWLYIVDGDIRSLSAGDLDLWINETAPWQGVTVPTRATLGDSDKALIGIRYEIKEFVWADPDEPDWPTLKNSVASRAARGGAAAPNPGVHNGNPLFPDFDTREAQLAGRLVTAAFDQLGAAEVVNEVRTLQHSAVLPEILARILRLNGALTVTAHLRKGMLAYESDDADFGRVTSVFDGQFAWSRLEGRGGFRLDGTQAFADYGYVLSPTAFLLTLKKASPDLVLLDDAEILGRRFHTVQAMVEHPSGGQGYMLYLDPETGRFAGIGTVRAMIVFTEWTEVGGLQCVSRARLDERFATQNTTLSYDAHQFNPREGDLFKVPQEIQQELDRMRGGGF